MRKVMSLNTKELFGSGLAGITWIALGFIQVFNFNKIVDLIIGIVCVIASILMFAPYFIKSEPEDEMAELNKIKAKSTVYNLLLLSIVICGLIAVIKQKWIVDLRLVMPFLMGGVTFLEFVFFFLYEKVGD